MLSQFGIGLGGLTRGGGAAATPAIANQAIDFGRLTLVGAGGAMLANTGGAISSVTLGTRTVGSNHFNTSTYPIIPSSVPSDAQYVWTGCTATGPGGVSSTFTLTINTAASAYSVISDAQRATVIALGAATISGKSILHRAGTYAYVAAEWQTDFTSQTTFASHDNTSRAVFQFANTGGLSLGSPQNFKLYQLKLYFPWVSGVSPGYPTHALEVGGVIDGFVVDDCELYSDLGTLVTANGVGWLATVGNEPWNGLLSFTSGSTIGAGGYTITNNLIHDAYRPIIIPGNDIPNTTTVGPIVIKKNTIYNYQADGLILTGDFSGAVIRWNKFYNPLANALSGVHGDAIQTLSYWDLTNVDISYNFVWQARFDHLAGADQAHQGIFLNDITLNYVSDTFTADDQGWTKGTGWSIAAGLATFAGGASNSELKLAQGAAGWSTNPGVNDTERYRILLTIGTITNNTGNLVVTVQKTGATDVHATTYALNTLSNGQELTIDFTAGASYTDGEFILKASSTSAAFTVAIAQLFRIHDSTNLTMNGNFVMAMQAAGLAPHNMVGGQVIGNTVVGLTDLKAVDNFYPLLEHVAKYPPNGDGAALIADNTAYDIISDFGTDTQTNNIEIAPASQSSYFAGTSFLATDFATVAQVIAAFTPGSGEALDTAVPKVGAIPYINYATYQADHPRLNRVAAFTVVDLTSQVVNTLVTSAACQITDIDMEDDNGTTTTPSVNGALVSLSGGTSPQFRITSDAGGASVVTNWTSTPAIIDQSEYLWVRDTSSVSAATATNVTVKVGNRTDTWTVTTAAAGTWTEVFSEALVADDAGWSGYTHVDVYDLAEFSATGGSKIRLTLGGHSTNDLAVAAMYLANGGGGDVIDFGATPVQVTVSASGAFTVPFGTTIVTDELTFVKDGVNSLVVSRQYTNAANDDIRRTGTGNMVAGSANYYKNALEASTVNKTLGDYTVATGSGWKCGITKIELFI